MRKFNFEQVAECLKYSAKYIPQTLQLVALTLIISIIIGFVIAVVRAWKVPVLSQFFTFIVTVFKGIPIYLLLILSNLMFVLYFDKVAIHFGWSLRAADVNVKYFAIVMLVIGFFPGTSELIRGALLSVPKGQYEAGYAVGLKRGQILRRIIVPQMIPALIPGLTSLIIGVLKASALAYCLGVTDILNASLRVASTSYNLLEAYVAAAIYYWAISIIIEIVMHFIGKKFNVNAPLKA